jgi:hypothetical protein
MKKILVGLALCLFLSNHAYASEPDFYIAFSACKIAAGYLVMSDESLKIVDGDPTTMGCSRKSNTISCFYSFEDEKK